MNDDHVAVVWKPFAAFNSSDWDTSRASMADDFTHEEVFSRRTTSGIEEQVELAQGRQSIVADLLGTFEMIALNRLYLGNCCHLVFAGRALPHFGLR